MSTPPRVWVTPLAVLLVVTAAGLVWTLSIRSQLPDPVATHWGGGSAPNGFSSVRSDLVASTLLTLLVPLALLGLGVALKTVRPMAAFTAGFGVGMALVTFGSTIMQRGLADAHQAKSPDLLMAAAVGAGLVVGGLAWLVVRPRDHVHAVAGALPAGARTVDVPAGVRLAWTGATTSGVGTWVALVVSVLPTLVMAVVFAVHGSWVAALMLLLTTGVGVTLMTMMYCRVTIDQRGVRAMGLGILPWVRVPLDTIEAAEATSVSALGDFGGWGLRVANNGSGARGLVTASGTALRVHRAGMPDYLLTVPDADRAAAVLNTLVERRNRASH